MRLRYSAVFLLAAGLTARADTIVQNFSANFSSNRSASFSQTIARFDPSLGALTSVTESVMGTVTTSLDRVLLQLDLGGTTLAVNAYNSGLQNVSLSGSTTSSSDLASATGAGFAPFTLVATNESSGASTFVLAGNVTYTYTPRTVAVTPEPSSLALLGTGLLGLVGAARRRFV